VIQFVSVALVGGEKLTPIWSQIAPCAADAVQHQRQVRRHVRGQYVPAVPHGQINRCITARPDRFSDRHAGAKRVGTGLGFGAHPLHVARPY
jgi:hypothetical protein